MDNSLNNRETVSDLMDGRLRADDFSAAVQAVQAPGSAREAWHSYHLVGDVLRSADLASGADDAAFLSRFQARLRQLEPLPLAGGGMLVPLPGAGGPASDALAPGVMGVIHSPQAEVSQAANDERFSWKWVAGFASLMLVIAAGWNMAGGMTGQQQSSQLAAVQPEATAVLVETGIEGQLMLRDPRLDQLLMAHRQSGGASALQVPSGFLRNATFEVSGAQVLP
jgi:sigma-E factor negative regulatory protein RseA